MRAEHPYCGRFAPSPTGPLHLGSLIAAVASYLDAHAHDGRWLLRMEDLDPPREQPGAAQAILASLEDHGLLWHAEVLWQSRRHAAYHTALEQLEEQGLLFKCDCTRALLGPGGACAGRCLPRQADVSSPCAIRVAVPADCVIAFTDGIQGKQSEALGQTLPDFILQRRDGLFAYQLAVVVDDAFGQVSHIVRGSDLLESTSRQIYLQQQLGAPTPHYSHLPVITNAQGQKLSKQNHAPPLLAEYATDNLRRALQFLNQPAPPAALVTCRGILEYARDNWCPAAIPQQKGIVGSGLAESSALPTQSA